MAPLHFSAINCWGMRLDANQFYGMPDVILSFNVVYTGLLLTIHKETSPGVEERKRNVVKLD